MADNVNGMYSFEEYTDMILIYGKVNKNGLAAVQEYRDTFPHRRTPDRKTFAAVERRLRETGSFKPKRIDTGRQRSARNYNNEQAIINAVELSPTTSTRRLSPELAALKDEVMSSFRRSCTTGLLSDRKVYIKAKKLYRAEIIEAKKSSYANFILNSDNTCRAAWQVVKSELGSNSVYHDIPAADVFANFFLEAVNNVRQSIPQVDTAEADLVQVATPQISFKWSTVSSMDIYLDEEKLKERTRLKRLTPSGRGSYDRVKGAFKEINLFSKELILFPLHLRYYEGGHRAFIAVKPKLNLVRALDSLAHPRTKEMPVILQFLERNVTEKKILFDREIWMLCNTPDECPKQRASTDCRAFICAYAELLSAGSTQSGKKSTLIAAISG
ncbi:hypothetical protein J6590_106260 [Homalodisca vitripennis]|nr:hypothetical protein J6590_106260 [Homalodisca vitripennis]